MFRLCAIVSHLENEPEHERVGGREAVRAICGRIDVFRRHDFDAFTLGEKYLQQQLDSYPPLVQIRFL